MATAKIRVVLADEFPIVLTGLRALLADARDVEVVAETSRSHELAALVERVAPDVLVVDARMGMAATVARDAATRVLVLSGGEDAEALTDAWPLDAAGFLRKDAAVTLILAAVRRVAHGETGWFRQNAHAAEGAPPVALTPRELAFLRLVVAGKTNHEIGAALGIGDKTVEKHMGVLFDKLAVTSRVEAAVVAVQQRLV